MSRKLPSDSDAQSCVSGGRRLTDTLTAKPRLASNVVRLTPPPPGRCVSVTRFPEEDRGLDYYVSKSWELNILRPIAGVLLWHRVCTS